MHPHYMRGWCSLYDDLLCTQRMSFPISTFETRMYGLLQIKRCLKPQSLKMQQQSLATAAHLLAFQGIRIQTDCGVVKKTY